MALFYCYFQSRLSNTLEDCPNVPVRIRSVFGCTSNTVHILSTLVNFDNWVQIVAHKTWECRHWYNQTLWKISKAKVLTAKLKATISTDLWSAICKLRWAWKQSSLQKRDFPTRCCGAACDKMVLLVFGMMCWRRVSGIGVLTWPLTEDWRISCIKLVEFLPNFLNLEF